MIELSKPTCHGGLGGLVRCYWKRLLHLGRGQWVTGGGGVRDVKKRAAAWPRKGTEKRLDNRGGLSESVKHMLALVRWGDNYVAWPTIHVRFKMLDENQRTRLFSHTHKLVKT